MRPRHAAQLVLLAGLWGASYLLIKYALEDFSPGAVVFLRTGVASLALYALIRFRGGLGREAIGDARRRPGSALALGLLGIAAPFLLIAFGELEVDSGLTAVLVAPAALFVALLAPLIDPSERMTSRQVVGLFVGIAGIGLLVGVETVQTTAELIGALGILGAALSYALASFVVKRSYGGVPAETSSLISVAAAALLTLPFALADLPDHAPGARAVAAIIVLGVGGTAIAFVLYYRLIAELGAGQATLVSYLVPPLSLAYGAVLLDESVTVAALVGLVLILAGVALAARRSDSAGEQAAHGGASLRV